jgi:O-antigen/teichoic acid export membrane protein
VGDVLPPAAAPPRGLGWRLSGYGAVLVVQTVVGLIQTAGLLRAVGPQSWGVLNVAQAAGLIATTVVTAGLGSFGAATVALHPDEEQPDVFLRGARARTMLFLGLAAVLVLVSLLLAPRDAFAAALVGTGSLLAGLGASWYFIGRGEPARWLTTEVVPLGIGTLAGVALALATGSALAFAVPFVLGAVAGVTRARVAVLRDRGPAAPPVVPVPVRAYLREHASLLTAGVAGGVNGYGPALLLGATGAPQVPVFLLLDRMVKYVVAAAAPALQVAQRWVPAGDPARRRARGLRVLVMAGVVAIVAGVAFLLLAEHVARLLSSGTVVVGAAEVRLFAALVVVLLVTQVNALAVLVALGGRTTLARTTAVGAVVLVVTGSVAAVLGGPSGVVWTVLVVESGILAVQLVAVLRSGSADEGEHVRKQ